jgi:hypothetical protein
MQEVALAQFCPSQNIDREKDSSTRSGKGKVWKVAIESQSKWTLFEVMTQLLVLLKPFKCCIWVQ